MSRTIALPCSCGVKWRVGRSVADVRRACWTSGAGNTKRWLRSCCPQDRGCALPCSADPLLPSHTGIPLPAMQSTQHHMPHVSSAASPMWAVGLKVEGCFKAGKWAWQAKKKGVVSFQWKSLFYLGYLDSLFFSYFFFSGSVANHAFFHSRQLVCSLSFVFIFWVDSLSGSDTVSLHVSPKSCPVWGHMTRKAQKKFSLFYGAEGVSTQWQLSRKLGVLPCHYFWVVFMQ